MLSESPDRDEFVQMLNQQHPLLNLLLANGMIVAGVDTDDSYITIDVEYPGTEQEMAAESAAVHPAETAPASQADTPETTPAGELRTDTHVTPTPEPIIEEPATVPAEESADELDENGHRKNTSPHAVSIRRAKLRNIFKAISASATGHFDDVYAHYGSVYGQNRFAVWLWIFESKGWVHFDNRWNVVREPTDNELDEVTKAYLQRHGNYDTPDSTCLDDLRKREGAPQTQRKSTKKVDAVMQPKQQTEMSWPEMKRAYASKRSAVKQDEPDSARSPPETQAEKPRRVDWDKILDGARDILFDATEPMTATSIRRGLGENAPSLPGLIDQMGQDDRFQSNDEKRWSLANEDAEALESRPPEKTQTSTKSMVNPELDNKRMLKWRQDLGPDKKPYTEE